MKYKYITELKKGSTVHIMGIPHEIMNDTFVGTNTNIEAFKLGSMTSPKKAISSKKNGKLGGRPKKIKNV